MRLCISLLLVTLALCCYKANAIVCPSLLNELANFLLGNDKLHKILLESYGAPPEAVAAKVEVKKCVDQISLGHRLRLSEILAKIVLDCS
ncbi:secretoglobin family 1D member 2-like [Choloepus didactylus]|uniref:secretoglobin family 1D member 2-like n=1 Tax=Choloepus didactylus TaxID=27675 RepID=UPI00189C8761|nr:secretoglobin family 1D member 2-like [Choloepus didactylus]